MIQRSSVRGTQAFFLIWFGQLVSLVGSGLTGFALGIWVYQRTGSVTQFALISLFTYLPGVVISPLAGTFVDRWDRRWVMAFSDTGAGFSTLAIALLLFAGRLDIWHIYIATAISSIFSAFQRPAYYAATTLLVPKEHLGRASGMVQVGLAAGQIVSPVLAGLLLGTLEIQGVILIDFATYLFALLTLLVVRIPAPGTPLDGQAKRSLLRETADGWTYIAARPGLVSLLIFFTIYNFLTAIVSVIATPLVLSFASVAVLGIVMSISGSGMVIGSIVMSVWGGPSRRVYAVLGFSLLSGLCILLAGPRESASLVAVAGFVFFFVLPIINGCTQTIFRVKVVPDMQGRVFALGLMAARAAMPLAHLVVGPLADRVFDPLLAAGGPLAGSVGQIIGVGPERGKGLMFVVAGTLIMLAAIAGYLYPRLRLVDQELPDAVDEKDSVG